MLNTVVLYLLLFVIYVIESQSTSCKSFSVSICWISLFIGSMDPHSRAPRSPKLKSRSQGFDSMTPDDIKSPNFEQVWQTISSFVVCEVFCPSHPRLMCQLTL